MDPDLAITICFVCEVFVFALAFAFYVAHEAHAKRAAPERGNRQKEIS